MALTKYTASTAIIAALADLPNATSGLTAAQLKAKFDENPTAFKTFVNSLIDELEAITAGASGAHQIGSAPITGVTGATVYAQLVALKAVIDAAVIGTIPDGTLTNAKLSTDIKVGSLAALTTTDKSSVVAAINEHAAEIPSDGVHGIATTANLTYYVRTDGSDSNTGLANTAGGAFLTIQHAIDALPQIVNHIVIIQVADGTYNESILLEGFVGEGEIRLNGATSLALAVNVIVNQLHYQLNTLTVYIKGFSAKGLTDVGILCGYNPGYSEISMCRVTEAAAQRGIANYYSNFVLITDCIMSNRVVGLYTAGGKTWSTSHTAGSGNTIGLFAEKMGVIGKNGTQPSGTTAESTATGGTISAA